MSENAPAEQSLLRVLAIGRNPRNTVIRIAILVCASFLVFKFILLPIRVEGISMEPTYSGGIDLVNRLAYVFHEPRRGDVVSIRLSGLSVMYMKRIIGLPGESVAFHEGHVFINGHLLVEPYVKYPCFWEHAPRQLGSNEYYVVGDNRSMPQQDHTQGKAERERIVGKVLF